MISSASEQVPTQNPPNPATPISALTLTTPPLPPAPTQTERVATLTPSVPPATPTSSAPTSLEHKINIAIKINPDQYFRLSTGKSLTNLDELKDAINAMPDDLFKQYVNDEKNDFANWIRFVFKYERIANAVGPTKSRNAFLDVLSHELAQGVA